MSLTRRKPRPLVRDNASLRDDRLFIVACDDTYAPKQYFDFFRFTRVKIHVVPTVDGTCAAKHVLQRLLQFEHEPDDELWLLLDTDHYVQGTHIAAFVDAIREARQRNVNVAVSKPCFEFWLMLHHGQTSAHYETCADVSTALRAKLGQYNKTNLRSEQYSLASVVEAYRRAKRIDEQVTGGEIPASNTTRVYLLWKAIAAKALPSQLPAELHPLLP